MPSAQLSGRYGLYSRDITRRQFLGMFFAGAAALFVWKYAPKLIAAEKTSNPDLDQICREWNQHVQAGEGISAKKPELVDALWQESVSAQTGNLGDMVSYGQMTKGHLFSFIQTNGFSHERILELVGYLKKITSRTKVDPITDELLMSDAAAYMENKGIEEFIKKTYQAKDELDCKAISSLLIASYLLRLIDQKANGEMELVSGLYFQNKLAPNGMGHQWARINGRIVDLALYPFVSKQEEGNKGVYVPIVGTYTKMDRLKALSTRTIHCYPATIEAEHKG